MTATPTDGARASAEVLRDLGSARARFASVDDGGEALMRLAAEPLLLHQFLRHKGRDELAVASTVTGTFWLVGLHGPHTGVVPCGGQDDALDSTMAQSVQPEKFTPSAEDVAQAMVQGGTTQQRMDPSRGWRMAIPTLLAAALIAFLVR